MYPAPPILIRRALEDVTLPAGGMGREITLKKGTDCFIAVWNLHRSPDLWDEPDKFDPMRFKRPFNNSSIEGWGGLQPELFTGLYPNENATGEFLSVLESVWAIVLIPACFVYLLQISRTFPSGAVNGGARVTCSR